MLTYNPTYLIITEKTAKICIKYINTITNKREMSPQLISILSFYDVFAEIDNYYMIVIEFGGWLKHRAINTEQ